MIPLEPGEVTIEGLGACASENRVASVKTTLKMWPVRTCRGES